MDKARLLDRLRNYEQVVAGRIQIVKESIERGDYGEDSHKIWLEQFAIGKGLDICSGHIPMRNTEGVDSTWWNKKSNSGALGPLCHVNVEGDDLGGLDKNYLDFIVTNYFDTFSSPLKALNEWHRVLKPGGTLAIVCSNAEKYTGLKGPLSVRWRANVQTATTIRFYLGKAEFDVKSVEEAGTALHVVAKKK